MSSSYLGDLDGGGAAKPMTSSSYLGDLGGAGAAKPMTSSSYLGDRGDGGRGGAAKTISSLSSAACDCGDPLLMTGDINGSGGREQKGSNCRSGLQLD